MAGSKRDQEDRVLDKDEGEMRQLGWTIPAMFCGLLLWSYPAFAQLSFKEAFERAKTDWQVELPHSKGYFYTCDDGFLFRTGDKTGIYRYNIEGKKLWEKTDPRRWEVSPGEFIGPLGAIGISQDGKFSLITRADEDFGKPWCGRYYEYLDYKGDVIWRIHRDYGEGHTPYISRTGRYLINVEDPMAGRDVLTVWDGKTGEVLWRRKGELSPWKAKFAGEDRIAYYHDVTLYLLDSATGDVIWSRNLRSFLPEGFGGVDRRNLSVSRDGTKIAVAMYGTARKAVLVLFDQSGNMLWTKEDFNSYPYESAFSKSGRILLIHEGSFWILVDALRGAEIWRVKEKIRHDFTLPGRGISFEDDIILFPSKFHGTGVLELDKKFMIERYYHFDQRIFVFTKKDFSGRKAIIIERCQDRLKVSGRMVNLGRRR